MRTVQVSLLNGMALDWAVAQCEDLPVKHDPMGFSKTDPECLQSGFWVWEEAGNNLSRSQLIGHDYAPSEKFQQGGEIIQRERISLEAPSAVSGLWTARIDLHNCASGETPLIAAMRCYVMSKLGHDFGVSELVFRDTRMAS